MWVGSECVEATAGALDLTHTEEIGESALDLECGRMGATGVERGNGDGIGSLGDDLEEVLR